MLDRNLFLERRWIYGIPAPIWLKNEKLIEQLINEYKLKPISGEYLMGEKPFVPMEVIPLSEKKEQMLRYRPIPFPGGMRIPHLHFRGDIYQLNDRQWSEFSSKVVNDFKARLGNINKIGFEQVMEMSEVIDSIQI